MEIDERNWEAFGCLRGVSLDYKYHHKRKQKIRRSLPGRNEKTTSYS